MQSPGVSTFRTEASFSTAIRSRSISRDRLVLTAVPALLATFIAIALLSLHPGVLVLSVLMTGLAIVSLTIRERRNSADSIILVGRSTMAAVIASSMEEHYSGRRIAVLRADHLGEAAALARTHRIDEIVLVGTSTPYSSQVVDSRGVLSAMVPGAEKLERLLSRIPLEFAVEDRWLNRLPAIRPLETGYAFTKRMIDVIVAVAIAVILLPLLPLVALAIKLDSRGPILYSQERVGLSGRIFRIYKFRTMRIDAEVNGAVWATKRDPRITQAGKFMRKTRLDELPQIWNLLRGDMALVGPRPERPEFTETLAQEIPAYDLRHTVKPGLTGWAQVCYRYTSTIRDTRAKVEYDLYYVKHCSLLFDLRIMLRTIKVVVGMQGQ